MISEVCSDNLSQLPTYLYSAEQTRALDHALITKLYDRGYDLMEKAGSAAFKFIQQQYPQHRSFKIFCGKGNNGGDGLVIARLALESGYDVEVIFATELTSPEKELSETCYLAFQALNKLKIKVQSFDSWKTLQPSAQIQTNKTVLIDALLGTGLSGTVKPSYKAVIDFINAAEFSAVYSIDVPSGLSSDSGMELGCAVHADITLTFIGINKGLVTGNSRNFTGRLFFSGLGTPEDIYDQVKSSTKLLSLEEINTESYKRKPAGHKGDSGRAVFIGGVDGLNGAAVLASEACLRSGVGLLTAIVGERAILPILTRSPEIMVQPLLSDNTVSQITTSLQNAHAVCIGPGLGKSSAAKEAVIAVLKQKLPTIIDADALNLLSENPEIWKQHGHSQCILTPHPKEAARLLNIPPESVNQNRFLAIEQLVDKFACTVLLKGSGTLISSKRNNILVCICGNESLSVGGAGDTLSGILLAALAKSRNALNAANYGAFVHGYAAELASQDGVIGVLPSDLMPFIRLIINKTAI
ncbi:NAD(P)H-hydrate dehydratase [Litoribacillus peritrichatus]|uniref:Bifunctional NAD(P)H-hydrate repair enzyme n=1 Tax=Litoribacillus peritrichatus TaxID=718191 RepID=A0ABP7MCP1_9GAMM